MLVVVRRCVSVCGRIFRAFCVTLSIILKTQQRTAENCPFDKPS